MDTKYFFFLTCISRLGKRASCDIQRVVDKRAGTKRDVLFSKEMRLAYFGDCSISFKPHVSFSSSLKNEKRSEKWALSPNKNYKGCEEHFAGIDKEL